MPSQGAGTVNSAGAPPAAQAVGMALAAAGAFLCAQAGSLARAEHKLRDAGKRRDSE